MTFSSKATARRASAVAGGGEPGLLAAVRVAVVSTARQARCVLAALVGAALLTSCGGGTSQYEPFQPKRVLVFGDDDSVILPGGRKYGVNGLDTNGLIDCRTAPNWVQQVANLYGFVFAECNPTQSFELNARMLAQAGAKVADVTAQVEAQVAAGGFRDRDMATLLAGTNDIVELYNRAFAVGEDVVMTEARARGQQLARVVNRLVDLGVKVIVSDLPDVGLTPFATNQNTLAGNTRPAELMTRLTTAFNEQLGVNVVLDGRFVGLVQAQLRFQAIGRAPGAFGLANISNGICTAPLPDCTTSTLVEGAQPYQWLWADDTRLSPGGQAQLATLAVDRAQRNPF